LHGGDFSSTLDLSSWSTSNLYSLSERDAAGDATSGSFKITSPASATQDPPAATQCVHVVPGSYLASAEIRPNDASVVWAKGQIKLRFFSGTNCTTPLTGAFASSWVTTSATQSEPAWQRVTLLKTAPPSTQSAKVSLVMARYASSATSQTMTFDRVSLASATCKPGKTVLCLFGRYKVAITSVSGITADQFIAVPLYEIPGSFSEVTFSYTNGNNHRLLVMLENDCRAPLFYQRLLIGGIVDFPLTLTMTDTVTGDVKTYAFDPPTDGQFFPSSDDHLGCVP